MTLIRQTGAVLPGFEIDSFLGRRCSDISRRSRVFGESSERSQGSLASKCRKARWQCHSQDCSNAWRILRASRTKAISDTVPAWFSGHPRPSTSALRQARGPVRYN